MPGAQSTKWACWLAIAIAIGACAGEGERDEPAPERGSGDLPPRAERPRFTVSPVEIDRIRSIVPLGNLTPPDHTLPTAHAYLYLVDPRTPVPVRAPASGTVVAVLGDRTDAGVTVRVNERVAYSLGHVDADEGLRVGTAVSEGQRLGHTSTRSLALDFGAMDEDIELAGFVSRDRYPATYRHAVSPLGLFEEPVASELYGRVDRRGPDLDGRVDFDVPGRLAGGWFLEGTPIEASLHPTTGAAQLAFVRDVHDPGALRISIGGALRAPGVFAVQAGAPDPESVGPDRAVVRYELFGVRDPSTSAGTLLAVLIGPNRARVEYFAPGLDSPAELTAAARTYTR